MQLKCWMSLSEHSLDTSRTRHPQSPLPLLSAQPSFFFPSVSIPLFWLSSPPPHPPRLPFPACLGDTWSGLSLIPGQLFFPAEEGLA